MTETTPRRTAAPEATTQQLRVTPAPLPGPLDPARHRREPVPQTEVLSIDDLMNGAATAPAPPVPAAPAAPPVPAAPAVAAGRHRSEVSDRLRADAVAAWTEARRQTLDWLGRGDNALIVATVALALLLLMIIAAVG